MTKAQNGEVSTYNQWLAAEIQEAIDDPRPSVPHDEVMARMDARIADQLAMPSGADPDFDFEISRSRELARPMK